LRCTQFLKYLYISKLFIIASILGPMLGFPPKFFY